jgi:hypothetical protein
MSDSQTAELVQPGEGTFHHTACFAKSAAGADAPLANDRLDLAMQYLAVTFAVVSAIRLQTLRPRAWTATASGNLEHALNQRHQLRVVVAVDTSENNIYQCAVAIDEQVVLTAHLVPISRVGPRFSPWMAGTDELSAITAINRAGWHPTVSPAILGAVCPRRQRVASRGHAASMSCQSRIPFI